MSSTWLDDYRETHWHPSQRKHLELPARFRDATPLGIPDRALRQAVQDYINDAESWIVQGVAPGFFGAARKYKSYAAAVISRFVDGYLGLEVEWVDCGEVYQRLEDLRFQPETQTYLERLKSVPFLVHDDFTNVRERGWASATMTAVSTARFNAMRPTLWTGNVTLGREDLKRVADLYGTCLARRLYDGSDGFRVVIS